MTLKVINKVAEKNNKSWSGILIFLDDWNGKIYIKKRDRLKITLEGNTNLIKKKKGKLNNH